MLYQDFDRDREYLVNKFRKPAFDPSTGKSNEEITAGFLELAERLEVQSVPRPVIKARCFEYVCRNMRIDVDPHDYFPGFGPWDRRKRILRPLLDKWNREIDFGVNREINDIVNRRNAAGLHLLWKDFDHSVPDWDSLVNLGFPGLRARAAEYRKKHEVDGTLTPEAAAHFDAMEITVKALLDTLGRLIDFAREKHPGDPRIAEEIGCLEQLRSGPPRDFYEVLQLIYLQFYFSEYIDHMQVRSLGGNLDVLLLPFYRRDLQEGRVTPEKIRELMTCFLMQWGSIDNYWGHPFYLGGTGADGETLYNEVSYLILDVIGELAIPTPKIQLKIAGNTPLELLDRALTMVRDHHCSLTFVSEKSIRRALMGMGFTGEDARTCHIFGCYEFTPRSALNVTASSIINVLKNIELVFNDGLDRRTGFSFGCGAAKLEEIKTFDEFYRAFLAYLDENVETLIRCTTENEQYLDRINPAPLYSLTIRDCLEKGIDGYARGNRFNLTQIQIAGIGSTVDALMAVKKYVFDTHELTLPEFRDILNRNWEGAEILRRRILHDRMKYGNGIEEVDRYAEIIIHFIAGKINRRPNARNGFYIASGHAARTFITMGKLTGATPDGRLAGEELSKNLSPTMGADTNGVTALIRSATTIDSIDLPGDFPLDVMLHPTSVQGAEGLTALKRLIFAYFERHGIDIQFNVFNAAELEEAQKHPEKYANLQIRVCGWNVRFVELAKTEQDTYIMRAKNIIE